GSTGVYVMSLQKEAAPGASSSDDIDWEDIHHRVTQPTTMEVHEAAISADGSRVAFSATVQNRTEVWVASASGEALTRVTPGNVRPRQIQWSRRRLPFADILYFRDGNGQIHIARIPTGSFSPPSSSSSSSSESGSSSSSSIDAVIPFKAKMT